MSASSSTMRTRLGALMRNGIVTRNGGPRVTKRLTFREDSAPAHPGQSQDGGNDMNRARRIFVRAGAAAIAAVALRPAGQARAGEQAFEVTHTEEEWRKILSPNAFQVLRKEATERPFTSPLNKEHREGVFRCAGCDL